MYRMRSYTDGPNKIHPLAAVVFTLAVGLGGCSQVSVPMGSNNVATPTVLTGSIPSASDVAYSDIHEDDRAIIASHLDTLGESLPDGQAATGTALPWLNAVSGNSGTLTGIDTSALTSTGCLTFRTTANTIAGVKLYDGTACRDITRKFAVTALTVSGA